MAFTKKLGDYYVEDFLQLFSSETFVFPSAQEVLEVKNKGT
jgi:hypothetical protein